MTTKTEVTISTDMIGRGDKHPVLFIDLPDGAQFQTDLTLSEVTSSVAFLLSRFGVDVADDLADEIVRMERDGSYRQYMDAFPVDVLSWAAGKKLDATLAAMRAEHDEGRVGDTPVNLLDAVRAAGLRPDTPVTLNTVADLVCAAVCASTSLDAVQEDGLRFVPAVAAE